MTEPSSGLGQHIINLAKNAAAEFRKENEIPRIVLCGKTGAGKSSLMNALTEADVQNVGVVPTTQDTHSELFEEDGVNLNIIDAPGFGESGRHEERLGVLLEQTKQAHLLLLVVGFPDRSLYYEQQFLHESLSDLSTATPPVIVALNKIDMVPPVREWDPSSLNLNSPHTLKEVSINKWTQYVASSLKRNLHEDSIPCAVGEFWNDRENQYGIKKLREAIYLALPEAAKTLYARIVHDKEILEKRGQTIITTATVTAMAAGAQPIPVLPDAALITPIQVGMIIALAQLHGGDPSEIDANRLLGPIVANMSGRLLFQQLLKFLPGLGNVLGASVAGLLTYSLGQTYHYLMSQGIWEPEKEHLLSIFTKFWEKGKSLDFLKTRK